jgi:hypothetical protein
MERSGEQGRNSVDLEPEPYFYVTRFYYKEISRNKVYHRCKAKGRETGHPPGPRRYLERFRDVFHVAHAA